MRRVLFSFGGLLVVFFCSEDLQFEDQYNARRLGNWEYPKWYPERPRQRTKPTRIIANDNGHLLDGVKKENPWGNYLGTWDLPRRITREFAEKLAAPPERLTTRWQKKPPREKKEKVTEETRPTEQDSEVCCKASDKCVPASDTASDEAVVCGEALTCKKCRNAVCICDSNECPCSST